MAHDPFKYDCSDCEYCKYVMQDGIEVGRRCNLSSKAIESWGKDKCQKLCKCESEKLTEK